MRLLTGLVLALALTGCTSTDPPDSAEPSDSTPSATESVSLDPGPTPKVGECHALSWKEALAPEAEAAPVKCKKRHTAQTYFVGRLRMRAGVTVESAKVQRRVQRTCTGGLPRHLGGTPRDLRLNMAQAVWFTPSAERIAAGANWFRCDVVVVASVKKLQPLPLRTKGFGKAPAIAMCATAEPGSKAFARVTCGSKHTWVAVSTVDLTAKQLPSQQQVQDRMDPVCRDAARARASDPLDFTWSQESPTQAQWDAGQRYGICWAPS